MSSSHLHSLPTRRSSDLGSDDERAERGHREATSRVAHQDRCAEGVTLTSATSAPRRSRRRPRRSPSKSPPSPASAFSRDRKSTRLNSSHLGISYAVFCLK